MGNRKAEKLAAKAAAEAAKAAAKEAKRAAKPEVTVLEFIITSMVPYIISIIYNGLSGDSSMEEARMAGLVGMAAFFVLNFALLILGKFRLVLRRSKKGKKALEEAANAAKSAGKAGAAGKAAAEAAKNASLSGGNGGNANTSTQPKTPWEKGVEDARAASQAGGNIKWSEHDPGWLEVRDPGSGSVRGYKLNRETGEWESADGGSVLDVSGLKDWSEQRAHDRSWQDTQTRNVAQGRTAFDDKLNEMRARAAEEARKLEEESKKTMDIFNKYHTLNQDPAHLKEIIARDQRLAEIEGSFARERGNWMSFFETGAEWTLKGADIGMDILGEMTGPVGKHVIKNTYIASRNVAARLSDAVVYNKDKAAAFRHAIGDTVVDVVQSETSDMGLGYQIAANSGGDAYKGMMEAISKGENPLEGFVAGGLGGLAKTGTEKLMGKTTNFFAKKYAGNITKQMINLNSTYMKGGMKQSVHKGISQVLGNKMTKGLTLINDVGGPAATDVAKDITGKVVDAMYNTHSAW